MADGSQPGGAAPAAFEERLVFQRRPEMVVALAITHFTPQLISRSQGRSAVLSAAYRHCARMAHETEGRVVDYSAKRGLAHEEFLLPSDAPEW